MTVAPYEKPLPFMGMFDVEEGAFECEALRFIFTPMEVRFEIRATEGEYGPCLVEGRATRHAAGWHTVLTKSRYEQDGAPGGRIAIRSVVESQDGLHVVADWEENEETWEIGAVLEPFNLSKQQASKRARERPLHIHPLPPHSPPPPPPPPPPAPSQRLELGFKPSGLQYWPPRSRITVYGRNGDPVALGASRDYSLAGAMVPEEGRTARTSVVGI